MKYNLAIMLLSISVPILAQDCSSLHIEAIYPCTAFFSLDNSTNSCSLSSCYTQSPGNPLNVSNSTACFTSCCPGFIIPNPITRDSMVSCYNKFNATPDLVYIIGILMAIFISFICILLPCYTSKECPIYKLKQRILESFEAKEPEELKEKNRDFLQDTKITMNQKNYVFDPAVLEIDLIIEQQEDNKSSPESVCTLCSKNKVDCRLSCKHDYHIDCIAQSWKKLSQCPRCQKKQIFPLIQFCKGCFKTNIQRSSLTLPLQPFSCYNCRT